jgi:four helix bundle protein
MNDDTMIRSEEAKESRKLVRSARDLVVYRRAFKVALDVHKATLGFPKEERFALADQLRRSSKSICANLAEGFVRQKYSKAEFSRFLAIAEASAAESCTWLEFAVALGYITNANYNAWDDEFTAIMAMLSKLRPKQG